MDIMNDYRIKRAHAGLSALALAAEWARFVAQTDQGSTDAARARAARILGFLQQAQDAAGEISNWGSPHALPATPAPAPPPPAPSSASWPSFGSPAAAPPAAQAQAVSSAPPPPASTPPAARSGRKGKRPTVMPARFASACPCGCGYAIAKGEEIYKSALGWVRRDCRKTA